MNTVTELLSIKPDRTLSLVFASIAVTVFITFVVTSFVIDRSRTAREKAAPGLRVTSTPKERRSVIGFVVVLVLALVAVGVSAMIANHAADERRADLIATYLLDEHDLVVLSPVELVTTTSVTTIAVSADGDIFTVAVSWLDDVSTQLPDATLPDGFSPITVALEPLTP